MPRLKSMSEIINIVFIITDLVVTPHVQQQKYTNGANASVEFLRC